jgi:hypothetical protein
MKPKEPRGDEGSVMVFHVHQRKTLGENYKEVYELWREESNGENNYRYKIIVKPVELHSKSERITIGGIDKISKILYFKYMIQKITCKKLWRQNRYQR